MKDYFIVMDERNRGIAWGLTLYLLEESGADVSDLVLRMFTNNSEGS